MVSSGRSRSAANVSAAAELPQDAQKFAPAGSGWPQWVHAATGREPGAGRPQWEQKCTPEGSGAPHSQRSRGRRGPRVAASEAMRSASSSLSRCSIRSTSPARSMRSSERKRSRRTISTARPPTSRISISRRRASECNSRRICRGGGTWKSGSTGGGGAPSATGGGGGGPAGRAKRVLRSQAISPSEFIRYRLRTIKRSSVISWTA